MTEILSPCGGFDSVTAAVRTGADAIYLGAGEFNARHGAKNFTLEDFSATVKYCRINGVKVFVTLNTLVTDGEIDDAVALAIKLASLGADGFIVQDLGLCSALKKALPRIPLHASTQMSIHSASGLEVLKELGFCRVVAAREMSKENLTALCKKAKELDMEVEVFVHGALCMCMSGQCLMSSVIGGRSGNRGRCAQPCRLPFKVKNGNGYDLSLKDLSLVENIRELADMGVTSFKIEGRMKRPEYVAVATSACKQSLDRSFVDNEISGLLSSVFSRDGFTDGYYKNEIGPVMFGRRLDTDKTDCAVLSKIHGLYRVERQHIPLDIFFSAKKGEPIRAIASDGINSVEVFGDMPQEAINKPTDREFIESKLSKFGGTCYLIGNLTVDISDGLSVPGGVIGAIRNEIAEKLNSLRSSIKEVTVNEYVKGDFSACSAKTELIARFRSIDQIPSRLDGIKAAVLPVECDFGEVGIDLPIYAELPRGIMGTEEKISEQIKAAKPYIKGLVAENISAFELARKSGLPVVSGAFMNVLNSGSAEVTKSLGADIYTASFEADASAIKKMPKGKAFVGYGRIPLMLTRNCPNRNGDGCKSCKGVSEGVDRLGNTFKIACRNGFSEIFNNKPCWLLDRTDEFSSDYCVLYFTFEEKDEIEKIIDAAINKKPPILDHTRGLYYRTVL